MKTNRKQFVMFKSIKMHADVILRVFLLGTIVDKFEYKW